MKTITKKYNVYAYKELSKEAKEKALENLRDINVSEDNWYEFIFEEQLEKLEKMGFEDANILFSGFWSQGDGASFKAQINPNKFVKHFKLNSHYAKLLKAYEITGIISQSGNYYHSNTMGIDLDFDPLADNIDEPKQLFLGKMSEEFENEVLEYARIEADRIYRVLEKEYDYQTSEKAIIETFEANEYTFLKDGTLSNE